MDEKPSIRATNFGGFGTGRMIPTKGRDPMFSSHATSKEKVCPIAKKGNLRTGVHTAFRHHIAHPQQHLGTVLGPIKDALRAPRRKASAVLRILDAACARRRRAGAFKRKAKER